jgi:hypothetical protein
MKTRVYLRSIDVPPVRIVWLAPQRQSLARSQRGGLVPHGGDISHSSIRTMSGHRAKTRTPARGARSQQPLSLELHRLRSNRCQGSLAVGSIAEICDRRAMAGSSSGLLKFEVRRRHADGHGERALFDELRGFDELAVVWGIPRPVSAAGAEKRGRRLARAAVFRARSRRTLQRRSGRSPEQAGCGCTRCLPDW